MRTVKRARFLSPAPAGGKPRAWAWQTDWQTMQTILQYDSEYHCIAVYSDALYNQFHFRSHLLDTCN